LVGRERELQSLTGVLDSLASGPATIVVQGQAGQGKSCLLRWMVTAAKARGVDVVQVTGIEFERDLGYSGLGAALRPLLGRISELDDTLRGALEVALRLKAGEAPILTTYMATLELLSRASDTASLLVAVDDAQWVDPASLEAMVFTAHRCVAERVGFAFAQRAGTTCVLDQTGFDRIELAGLGCDAVVELLASYGFAHDVAVRCWELTDGNPLALIEGARGLSPAQRSGAEPLPAALPVAERLLEIYRASISDLPAATVRALGVAALETGNEVALVAAALAALGGQLTDLGPAEQRDLITVADQRVTWRHPLIRSAVHRILGHEQRRIAHRALADAAAVAGRDEQALWHLSATVVGPDDEIAGRLADLGVSARRRGALAAAADAHLQAAHLSTERPWADAQMLAAASARWGGGDMVEAARMLRTALDDVADPSMAARMAILLGQAELWLDGTGPGIARFEHHAAQVLDDWPGVAAFLLLHATSGHLLALDPATAALTAERAAAAAERSDSMPAMFAAAAIRLLARTFAGQEPAAADQLMSIGQLALAAVDARVESADDLVQLCAYGLIVCERWPDAIDLLRLVIRGGSAAGMIERTAFARLLLAEALWRTGRWAESLSELSQALSLQEAAAPGLVVSGIVAVLARVEAGFGREDDCRTHVADVLGRPCSPAPSPIEQFVVIASSAVGLLELGAGCPSAAALAFDQVTARAGDIPEPGWLWWQSDAIEAYAASARPDDAERALRRLEEQSQGTGRGWALAAVHRGRGLLGGPTSRSPEDDFSAALDGFRAVGAPFEEARTLLARGRYRLRAGSRADAGRDIAAARTIFDRLGARGWSDQASAARGEASGTDDSLASRLTAAELRVAITVARGASNREAAEELFLSIKTVDYHLQSIYRRLGLRSRTQLAALVSAEGRATPL
jgi:DNA-binding CsgD family transcriptional regulator